MDRPTIDHRGPQFAQLGREVLEGLKLVFRTSSPVIIYPSSGTGAWEAALVNTLSAGDRVLMSETGQFATLWQKLASASASLSILFGDWPMARMLETIEHKLAEDRSSHQAVWWVHNETSTEWSVASARAQGDR